MTRYLAAASAVVLVNLLVGCAHEKSDTPVTVAVASAAPAEEEPVRDLAGHEARCEKGIVDSCYAAGTAYYQGNYDGQPVEKNPAAAAALYAKACAGKHGEGCHMSGHAIFEGWSGEAASPEAGMAKLAEACELASGDACFDVAQTRWDNGEREAALPGIERSCELDSSKGCYQLGYIYAYNHVDSQERAGRAIDLLEKACARGHSPSCASVGTIYERGVPEAEIPVDGQRAMDSYDRACQLDASFGCMELGRSYQYGATVDLERARELYGTSCDADNPFGCTYLAALVYKSDPERARAAEDRACSAEPGFCRTVGDYYAKADGRKKDAARAMAFYTRGCEANEADACEVAAAATTNRKVAKELFAKACNLDASRKNACKKAK